LIIIICASVVLSIDYPFRMQILDDIYKIHFPAIWFGCSLGFYLMMKLMAFIFELKLPTMKKRYNFLNQ